LLKPVRRERLAETILRLKKVQDRAPAAIDADLLAALRAAAGGTARKYLRWINCGQGNEIDVIATSEVLYFQARDKYTCVITADKERYIRTPLRELINELDPDEFWQVHRASVIRVGALERAVRDDSSKSLVPVSQAFAGRFRQM
jgi:DNA-binding LytR/AlgR family response regulator